MEARPRRRNGLSRPLDRYQVVTWFAIILPPVCWVVVLWPPVVALWMLPMFAVTWALGILFFAFATLAVHTLPQRANEGDYFVCQWCDAPRPRGARHCRLCNDCRLGFDHHCRFINNCVTVTNYVPFFYGTLHLTVACWLLVGGVCAAAWAAAHGVSHRLGKTVWWVLVAVAAAIGLGMAVSLTVLFVCHVRFQWRHVGTYDFLIHSIEADRAELERLCCGPPRARVDAAGDEEPRNSEAAEDEQVLIG